MCERRRIEWVALVALAGLLSACEREARRFHDASAVERPSTIAQSDLHPGHLAPPPVTRSSADENAWAVSEGQRLFKAYNCSGCHFNGGGGMGPALMDSKWIYGSESANIVATILEGRPNGMPSFRGRVSDAQAEQLAAYVRSLAGLLRKDVAPGRTDHLDKDPSPQSTKNPPPTGDATAPKK